MTTTTMTTTTVLSTDQVASIEASLKSGQRITIKDLASTYGYKIATMRSVLVAIYGNRIRFKRGRTGGIELLP